MKLFFPLFKLLTEIAVVLNLGYTLESLWKLFKKYINIQAPPQTSYL